MIRIALLSSLIEKARASKPMLAVPLDVVLSHEEQQYLVQRGIAFTTDRQNRPMISYTMRQRAQDLRDKVLGKNQPPP